MENPWKTVENPWKTHGKLWKTIDLYDKSTKYVWEGSFPESLGHIVVATVTGVTQLLSGHPWPIEVGGTIGDGDIM